MPGIPGTPTPKEVVNLSVSLLCAGGDVASVSLNDVPAATTATDALNFANAVGALSNGGVFAYQFSTKAETKKENAVVLDETWSAATTKAIMIFQDDNLESVQIAVPAPDASIFLADGNTVNAANSLVTTFTTVVEGILNDGTGTYTYMRGYRATKTRQTRVAPYNPTQIEPSGLITPPDAPAT